MFWKLTLASSPVDAILDKENFTLEELLDEEEIIQECKALNTRLINFLRDRAQVEQLLHYIIEEAPEDADSKRAFKFPFIACEIFTCEIDVILKTLVEEDELMNLLVSFLEPNRPHSALLAGYFSKVVICLMLRKTVPLMNYVQAHQDIFRQLVDLIGITSIMEVLIRLVGADDHVYPNYIDVMQWLADGNLLEMIVDKLSPSSPPEVHANAAETLCAITRNTPSALATKLSSPSFVSRIFGHALEDSRSKSGLVHSLSVCISLLDPKKSAMSFSLMHSFRSQYIYEPPVSVNPETISAMLPKLGDLLMLLNVSNDEKVLPTTYGELKPPLGKHRLKIVEFISVLLKTDNEAAEKELVNSGTIKRILDLFFEYPYNNALHHHVESIILSSLETKSDVMVDHLLQDCDLIGKMLQTDKHPVVTGENNKTTMPAAGKQPPRAGNLGHITRIGNKLVQLGTCNSRIQTYLQEHNEWTGWRTSVLQERNAIENVYRWSCGRPTALQDRARDSDDDDIHDRDYDVAALANNISQAFRYNIYENEEAEEGNGDLDRDNEDVYFDDESAEVVISSLRLGDEQGSSLFTNSNWFAFQDERIDNTPVSTSAMELMEEINLNGTTIISDGNGSDDEVVVGEEDELTGNKESVNGTSTSSGDFLNGLNSALIPDNERASEPNDINFFKFDTTDSEDLFEDKSLPEWVGWSEPSNLQVGGSSLNPFEDNSDVNPSIQAEAAMPDVSPISGDDPMLPNGTGGPSLNPFEDNNSSGVDSSSPAEAAIPDDNSVSGWDSLLPNGSSPSKDSSDGSGSSDISQKSATVPSLFEEDVEFIGVEIEGTEKAMEQALKEGIVGEAGPLKRNIVPKMPEKDNSDDGARLKEFNDTNYWRVEQDVAVLE